MLFRSVSQSRYMSLLGVFHELTWDSSGGLFLVRYQIRSVWIVTGLAVTGSEFRGVYGSRGGLDPGTYRCFPTTLHNFPKNYIITSQP